MCACPLAALLALAACGEGPDREVEARAGGGRSAYRVIDFEAPGSIAGTLRWQGERPPPAPPERVRRHPEVCGAEQPSPTLQIGPRGGVANAVVSLLDIRAGAVLEPPLRPVEVAIGGCRFAPHVVALGVGWTVRIANADPLLHNVRAEDAGGVWLDRGLPRAGAAITPRVPRVGITRLLDDAGYPWMLGWVHAFPHPYFAVTDEAGSFRLENVPAGRYTVHVWHEGWRVVGRSSGRPRYSAPVVLTRVVSVSPRQESTADFVLEQRAGEAAGD